MPRQRHAKTHTERRIAEVKRLSAFASTRITRNSTMNSWLKKAPPYEGDEPYLYLAFAKADTGKIGKTVQQLLARGCRVWYACGKASGSSELIHRQERAAGAALTLVYLSDAACADPDTKSAVLVNQKFGRPIVCLDPDGTDRRLSMGLREDVPHVPLYKYRKKDELESAIIHSEGFSQEVMGEKPPLWTAGSAPVRLAAALTAAAVLIAVTGFAGIRFLGWFAHEPEDLVGFSDPVILSAVKEVLTGADITEEGAGQITALRMGSLPASWDDLRLLPALTTVELPQEAVAEQSRTDRQAGTAALPDGVTIVLYRGEPRE